MAHHWSGDLQRLSEQLRRQAAQRGCVNFPRTHSKLEGLRPEPMASACPRLVPAGASGRGPRERSLFGFSFQGARVVIPESLGAKTIMPPRSYSPIPPSPRLPVQGSQSPLEDNAAINAYTLPLLPGGEAWPCKVLGD